MLTLVLRACNEIQDYENDADDSDGFLDDRCGGWVIGSLASCSAFCGAVAAKGYAVLALDYALAPEHPEESARLARLCHGRAAAPASARPHPRRGLRRAARPGSAFRAAA